MRLAPGRRRLRTEAVAHFENVVASVTNLLNAAHVTNLKGFFIYL
jgi:hypothetical protein